MKRRPWRNSIKTGLLKLCQMSFYARYAKMFWVFQTYSKYILYLISSLLALCFLWEKNKLCLCLAKDQCGHCFCSSCIEDWLKTSKTCPIDKTDMDQTKLRPVGSLVKSLLAKWEFESEKFIFQNFQVLWICPIFEDWMCIVRIRGLDVTSLSNGAHWRYTKTIAFTSSPNANSVV